ncbi:dgd1 suppressor 1 [Prunus dulcis]|uniref:Dgd1 suppressor 1 n=1 Tax=Prunus dulcis TaxID=3755 RepID=A0A4Y1RDS7_PRUDU|nr:dgd1 suppressor 1 [Prunus dulcis]
MEITETPSMVTTEASRVCDVLHDILEHIFSNLHNIQKNMQFWQSRAEGSNAQKVNFMVLERGPQAFIEGTIQLIHGCVAEGSSIKNICLSASAHISERIAILTNLRCSLATFLAEVYMEIDRFGEELLRDPENSLPSLLIRINGLFFKLEASVGHLHAMRQCDSSVEGSYSVPLLFEKLPEINQEGSQWTDCEIRDAINLVYQNLEKLDSYLSYIVAKHRKPRKVTQYWIRYTCGVVGLSVCSMWLIGHSRLMGSPDIDNWLREARDSTIGFFSDHVEQPLLSIRDELFETFRKRHRGMMDLEEVQLTSNSLHRMLLAFSEQTKGQKFPENAPDQEMLEIVMARYEKELTHPITNLLNGELARAMLIQVQKLKLDIETAMLELNQILRANEINFAILAALPAFFLSLVLIMVVRAWFKQDTRAEGRGRIARLQRRLLVVEVEKKIMQYLSMSNAGGGDGGEVDECPQQEVVLMLMARPYYHDVTIHFLPVEKDAQCVYGLLLYSLDRLYHAVERHAKATGEWQWLSQDIIDLGKPSLQTEHKLRVTARLERL